LEQVFNRALFHRSNFGYTLTEAGESLLAAAEAMEGSYLEARGCDDEAAPLSGTVRVGAPDGFGSIFLAPNLHPLTKRHPNLEIEILATARIFSLSKREADIAISLSSPDQSRLISRRLTDYSLFIYASAEYIAQNNKIKTAGDLGAHPFVGYIEDMLFARELNYLQEINPNLASRFKSTNLLAQLQATLTGAGLCILPHFIASEYKSLVPILSDEISLIRSFHMLIHEDKRKAPNVREVSSHIVRLVENNKGLFLPSRAKRH
jgi:DNA-binding transcriptional LysR family regulator